MNGWLFEYLRCHGIPEERALRVDFVLALLRINTPGSLALAEELTGKPIVRCPPAMPPWPPKPISGLPAAPRVVKVTVPEKRQRTGRGLHKGEICVKSRRQLGKIRAGMTREKLRSAGVAERDVRRWTAMGLIEWSR